MTRADQIFDRFKDFHRKNPHIWGLFERYTFVLIRNGRKKYAVDGVVNQIRWHYAAHTTDPDVKINNDFRAYYARMFMAKNPAHNEFFELRKLISSHRPANERDIPVWFTGGPGDEDDLMQELRDL